MKTYMHVVVVLGVVGMGSAEASGQILQAPVQPNSGARSSVATFPDGAKLGYVDIERVAGLSKDGKAAAAKLAEITKQKEAEVVGRGKQVEALQQKVAQGSSILSESAFVRLQREFERAQVDFQRFREDAQAEVRDARQQLLQAFTARLFPVIGQVATEKKLWAVFSNESTLLWHDPALDLSEEVARRLDAPVTPKQ
jgi:outer membrane protein